LVVDQVLDTEEIVVKPLGKQLKSITVFAGATIMGDGDVALILDVLGLAERAHVVSERRESGPSDASVGSEAPQVNSQKILWFQSAAGQRMAIPLSRVTRLEKFPLADIERAGRFQVVQYWGQVMPLIDVSQCLADTTDLPSQPLADSTGAAADDHPPQRETLDVVVLTMHSRCVGLIVDRILDTVEDVLRIEPLRSRVGVIGTTVVQGHVTEMLDVDELIQRADPAILAQLEFAVPEV
jgi:two-component system chemotaxis sensor kinase CheA